ncbi:hypothetical protein ACHAQE_000985 [Botrytis cinerea]
MKSNDATPNGRNNKLWYFKNYDDSIKGQQFDEAYASNADDQNHSVDWTSGTEGHPIADTLDKKPFKVWGHRGNGRPQDIRRTIVTTSSTMQSVPFLGKQNHDATDDLGVQEQIKGAFLGLKTHYKSNAADGEGFQIGSKNYKMAYAVNRMEKEGDPYYETDRINQVADLTAEKMLPELWTKDKMSDERGWPSGEKILAEASHRFPFPKEIKVQVQVAEQAMLEWEDRDTVVFAVEKVNEWKVDSELNIAIKAAFKDASTVTTSGIISAVANGLGNVVGELAWGAC